VLYAEGKHDEALKAMSAAADAEDRTNKHVVTPGPLAPARELLGFMLLDAGQPKEAQAAFQKTITKEPGRFLGLYGAARAAEAAGDKAAAAALYKKLLDMTGAAQTARPALAHAKTQTASR
jgi:tetratricopeptide (TPR) repeat protein